MKKFINFVNHPTILVAISFFFFGITAIDTILLGATGWDDMYWWSKLSISIFSGILALCTMRYSIIPLFSWFVKLFKK